MARTPTRWQPFADLADIRTRFDRIIADLADGEHGTLIPELDVVEESDQVIVKVNVPGIDPEELKVEIEDDLLTVSGEHAEEQEETGKRFVRRERRVGSFSRTITLPEGAKRDEVDATCRNGVLRITVPLAEAPKHAARTITPKAG